MIYDFKIPVNIKQIKQMSTIFKTSYKFSLICKKLVKLFFADCFQLLTIKTIARIQMHQWCERNAFQASQNCVGQVIYSFIVTI